MVVEEALQVFVRESEKTASVVNNLKTVGGIDIDTLISSLARPEISSTTDDQKK